ncbi:hypothetical protein ACFX2I_043018 [Malus domestica]
MGRTPCCDKENVKRGPWSPEEDAALKSYLQSHGSDGTASNWIHLPKKAGLRRCGKSCRLRWLNYLRPDIKHGGFTEEEDSIICNLYNQMGSRQVFNYFLTYLHFLNSPNFLRWSVIASYMPGRTDNDVKNYWNTKLKKKLLGGKIKNISSKEPTIANNANFFGIPEAEKPQDSAFSTSEPQVPSTLQMLYDVKSGLSADNQTMSLNPDQLYNPKLSGFSDLGARSRRNYSTTVSLSQEGSSISDSSSMAGNLYLDQDSGFLMDYGFGVAYDNNVNHYGMSFGDKTSEVGPTGCTDFGDFF